MAKLGALLSGSYIFLGMIVFALAQINRWDNSTIPILAAPTIAWVIAWLLPNRKLAHLLIPLPPMVAIVAVLMAPIGVIWPPIATLTFASAIVAICMWPARLAAGGILFSAASNFAGTVVLPPTTLLISTDFLGGSVTTIVALTLPTAMLIVTVLGRRAAAQADKSTLQVLEHQAQQVERDQLMNARSIAARQVHETYLNSLVALADPDVDMTTARELCLREHARTPRLRTADELLLSTIVAAVAEPLRIPIEFTKGAATARFFETETARAFTSALHESVTNAERHAQGCIGIVVGVDGNEVEVVVEDDGPGRPDRWRHGMGISTNILDALTSVGGTASFDNRLEGGSRITLRVGLHNEPKAVVPLPAWDILIDAPVVRLCLIPTVLSGIVFVPVATQWLSLPLETAVLFGLFLLAELGLVFSHNRHEQWRRFLIIAVFGLGTLTLVVASSGTVTCESAVPMHWLMFSIAGGAILPIILLRSTFARVIAYLMWTAVTFAVSFRWPQECLIEPLGAAVEHLIWSSIIFALYFGLRRAYTRQQTFVWNAWREDAINQIKRRATMIAEQNLRFAADLALPAFEGVLNDRYRPGTKECQVAALSASSLTRTYLNLIVRLPEESPEELRPVIQSLQSKSWTIDTSFLQTVDAHASVAVLILRVLRMLDDLEPASPVEILALDDSIIISADSSVTDPITDHAISRGLGIRQLENLHDGRRTLEVLVSNLS